MILPLTHEHGTVRRLPLVTFAIMGLCMLVHLRVASESDAFQESETRFRTAMLYYLERPYLTADPRLAPPELADLLSELGAGELAHGQPSDLQQRTLDGYTDDWLESLKHHPLWTGGLLPAEVEPTRLVSYAFLHSGWLHLFGNLLFLYFMGPFVEDLWGRWAYAAFYLAGAVVAGLGFALHYPHLFRPLVGASGAVAAVMGAFLLLHGRAKIRFLYYLGFAAGTFSAPAWLMLPLWFGGELLSALENDAAMPGGIGGGVAYWAHVWGFAFGLGAAVLLRTTGIERRLRPPELDEAPQVPTAAADPVLGRMAKAQLQGRTEEAWQGLGRAIRDPGASPAVLEAYWDLARELRRPEEGARVLGRLIEDEVRRGEVARALSHWREVREVLEEEPADPRVGVRLAEALRRDDRRVEAEDVLREVVPVLGPGTPLGAVMKAMRLASDLGERDLRVRALDAALAHPHLPADVRADLELERPLR